MNVFKPGDSALIIAAKGTHSLIGTECKILEVLIDSAQFAAFNGQVFAGAADGSLSAFVETCGEVWFFDCKRLMPLRGDRAPVQRQEAAHG